MDEQTIACLLPPVRALISIATHDLPSVLALPDPVLLDACLMFFDAFEDLVLLDACPVLLAAFAALVLFVLVLFDAYASSGTSTHVGPEIKSIVMEDGRVSIETSPARSIYLITATRSSRSAYPNPGELISSADFGLIDGEVWFRFVVVDNDGYKAYSNAYFLK